MPFAHWLAVPDNDIDCQVTFSVGTAVVRACVWYSFSITRKTKCQDLPKFFLEMLVPHDSRVRFDH